MEITFLYDLVVNEIVDYRKEQEKIDGCFNKYERKKKKNLKICSMMSNAQFFKVTAIRKLLLKKISIMQ